MDEYALRIIKEIIIIFFIVEAILLIVNYAAFKGEHEIFQSLQIIFGIFIFLCFLMHCSVQREIIEKKNKITPIYKTSITPVSVKKEVISV